MHASKLILFLLPSLAAAHMAMWHPSVLDFNGDGYTAVTPLANLSFSEWWFHGMLDRPEPSESFTLPVGQSVTVETSCRKDSSSWGTKGDGKNACTLDTAGLHAGLPVINETLLMGCGLAIAYKSDFKAVEPEDFTIFSVNYECVKQLKTVFEVPKVMPACPDDKCVCAWFWQGQNSAYEMYMTGFRCNVSGGSSTATLATPKTAKYCVNSACVAGPKQPMYWANENPNIVFSGEYRKKPSYNAKWGYSNGAQDIVNPVAPATTLATVTGKPSATNECMTPKNGAGAPCYSKNDCSYGLYCHSGTCSVR